jgi:hypothetical protein
MRDITPLDELVPPRWEDAVVAYPWLQDSEEDSMTPTEWALLSQKEKSKLGCGEFGCWAYGEPEAGHD